MSFAGYKFKFELHASHLNLNYPYSYAHYHNFAITLYFHKATEDEELFLFDDVADLVKEWLEEYQGKYLGDLALFHNSDTTIESIGDIFYTLLKNKMEDIGFYLLRLEIYENPTRVYSVSQKLLDSRVNEINEIPSVTPLFIDTDDYRISITEEVDTNAEINKANAEKNKGGYEAALENQLILSSETAAALANEGTLAADVVSVKKYKKVMKLMLAILFLLASAVTIVFIIKDSGMYPRGSDTLCHIYRADLLLEHIKNGNWYPLYDKSWYNGVEIMRYWAPLPLYLLAFFQYISGGTALDAYLILNGFVFFTGGCGWLLFGWKYNRIGLAALLSLIWFFLPENMRMLFMSGNLPMVILNMMTPFLLYFAWSFIEEEKWSAIIPVTMITALMGLCHAGTVMMVLLIVIIYGIVYSFYKKRIAPQVLLVTGMLISILMIGIWLLPALHGGAASGSSTNQVMKTFFESAFQSLNPTDRMHGNLEVFYYGLSVFVICVLGATLGDKKVAPGFITTVLIFFSTTKSMYNIFVNLPLSQFFWMTRFIPTSLAFMVMSLIMWKKLKNSFVAILCILLILDILPSYHFIYVSKEYRIPKVETSQYEKANSLYINQAKSMTEKRLALLDLSRYGAFAPYYISGVEPKVNCTFGAGWEGAATASNIVQLNSALNGNYLYLFDRSLELGNDTVLFRIDYLKNKEEDLGALTTAGQKLGYQLKIKGKNSLVFHKEVDYDFGVITNYENLAIGESAKEIALLFPSFKEGISVNLNEYTAEELKQYKKIYLSGFTYEDKEKAEQLLNEIANCGVKIYIDMNKIPVDKKTNRYQLFNVSAQVITFQEVYPELYYKGVTYRSRDFATDTEEYSDDLSTWNTVYLDGIKTIDGYCNLNGQKTVFAGTSGNNNIYFLGLNLLYHVQTSNDEVLINLLQDIFKVDTDTTPERKLVPVDIEYQADRIIIKTEQDNVNTTLSYLDIFHSDKPVSKDNNLLVVNQGTTTIYLKYPYFKEGLMLSISGVILMILFLFFSYRYYNRKLADHDLGAAR